MCLTMHVTDACLRARVALTQDACEYATALQGHSQPHRGSHLTTASLFIATLSIRHPVLCLLPMVPAVTQAADGQLLACGAAACMLPFAGLGRAAIALFLYPLSRVRTGQIS